MPNCRKLICKYDSVVLILAVPQMCSQWVELLSVLMGTTAATEL
jgi:hypothetical protein